MMAGAPDGKPSREDQLRSFHFTPAAAHVFALRATERARHRIFNLGNGAGFSVREVIAAACRVTGIEVPAREAPRRAGDPPRLVASSDLIRTQLGWTPRKPSLEEMVADAWAFGCPNPNGYGE